MGIKTTIEWCDSTLNLESGCDGCELWVPSQDVRRCYAGVQIERYRGRSPGHAKSFTTPELFERRIEWAERWPDLGGTERDLKPWLNGLPRVIFLCDMGDPFTESLPIDWLAPHVERMAKTPHIYILLTKRPGRMRMFWEGYGAVPPNFWLMTSVTSRATLSRVDELFDCSKAIVKGVSYEPALEEVSFHGRLGDAIHADPCECGWGGRRFIDYAPGYIRGEFRCPECDSMGSTYAEGRGLDWMILGGESGTAARPFDVAWARNRVIECDEARTPCFIKQLGSNVVGVERLKDRKGGDWSEWPEELRVRQMPGVAP